MYQFQKRIFSINLKKSIKKVAFTLKLIEKGLFGIGTCLKIRAHVHTYITLKK